MRRRLKTIVLPICIIFMVTTIAAGILMTTTCARYRSEHQATIAGLVGIMKESNPDLDSLELAKALSDEQISSATRELGFEVLATQGILLEDWSDPDTAIFAWQLSTIMLSALVIALCASVVYFWWLDWRRTRRLNDLVRYLQDLSRQVYDLRLAENSEDELSLLTNELYKITVTLKEAAEQNRHSREQLEVALADISHQLRTPLTSLQITIDNIYDDPEMPTETRSEFLQDAARQIEHMSQLVMTLLNLAKFDNGTIQLHQIPLCIGDLLETVRANLAILADLNGVEIELTGDLAAEVSLDRHWQVEALTNITKNAIEHSQSGDKITLDVRNSPLLCKVTIRDTGEGMSPADRRHLFERFYRSAHSRPESVRIGLSFAKAIIEADHGQIAVKSELGVGTEFIIRYFKH